METLLKYCLSFIFIFLLISCNKPEEKIDKRIEAEKVYKEAIKYGQGNPECMNGIANAIEIDPTFDKAIRELSVAYLKRGMPLKWKPQLDKAVVLNPEMWLGYRAYCYLWFYRDYKKAIIDFDKADDLTPNIEDYPHGNNTKYWKGIAYLGLKDYKNSISQFQKYISYQDEKYGEGFVEVTGYLYLGIAYYESGNMKKATFYFDKNNCI